MPHTHTHTPVNYMDFSFRESVRIFKWLVFVHFLLPINMFDDLALLSSVAVALFGRMHQCDLHLMKVVLFMAAVPSYRCVRAAYFECISGERLALVNYLIESVGSSQCGCDEEWGVFSPPPHSAPAVAPSMQPRSLNYSCW